MSSNFRSKFESMVFESTDAAQGPVGNMTGGSVYGWMLELHPSLTREAESNEVSVEETRKHSEVFETRKHSEVVHRKKFGAEHLFEVVVMYLFNGLNASQSSGREDTRVDTTSLLHYLAYMIPEADKLHVVDLDAHTGFFDRMNSVRVLFDHTDYRFRVIVKKSRDSGWVDICLPLRKVFLDVMKSMPHVKKLEVCDCWVEIVTKFREELIPLLVKSANVSIERVNMWVLRTDDIRWETTTYSAGAVASRNLLRESNLVCDTNTPFVISYWADNYLEFDEHKMARVFNGLTGYGEFLYDRDNNYCRKATNNFFRLVRGQKRWLWRDLAKGSTDRTHDVWKKDGDVYDRSDMFEAVIKDGQVYVTQEFMVMVRRRHVESMGTIQEQTLAELSAAILPAKYKAGDNKMKRDVYKTLSEHLNVLSAALFDTTATAYYGEGEYCVGDGLLVSNVLPKLCKSLLDKAFDISHKGVVDEKDYDITDELRSRITRMMKAMIHTTRENWLLTTHTSVLDSIQLKLIQDTYKTNFWESSMGNMNLNTSSEKPVSFYERQNELEHVHMCNNSSLVYPYKDAAIGTHAVGYTASAMKNNIPCHPFQLKFCADVLQEYYDRKVHNDGLQQFVATCDLTSVLRTTQTLVRGLDRFIICIASDNHTKTSETFAFTPSLIQTTRTPFTGHGNYYVLEGPEGVFGHVPNPRAGKRAIHCDDVLTFAETLFTIVNNPGVWNLLNSGAGDSLVAASSVNATQSTATTRDVKLYNPQPANIGFVTGGIAIQDRPINVKSTWGSIAQMTYTKLRVGIMDQPAMMNTSRRYVNETLNNTRRNNSETILHTFKKFMHTIYNTNTFTSCFYNYDERHPTIVGDGVDGAHISIIDIIAKNAAIIVDSIHMRCRDSGLQTTDPHALNYAFPSLHNHPEVNMPQEKHLQLFYIFFGEAIYSMANDLSNSPVLNWNTPQELQHRSNTMIASHLRMH
jgi:hypothetical protein